MLKFHGYFSRECSVDILVKTLNMLVALVGVAMVMCNPVGFIVVVGMLTYKIARKIL